MARELAVFVAHSGRRLSLRISGSERVAELHGAVETLSGLRPADQILMLDGQPLVDKMQLLSHFGLPSSGAGSQEEAPGHIFLFSRAHMRAGAAAPALDTLPAIVVQEPGTDVEYEKHPLDDAKSPLIRVLPAFERNFRRHALWAKAFANAASARLAQANQLLEEMDVQGTAIDLARSNVEHHYNWIQEASAAFMRKYRTQAASHEEVLRRFERDVDALRAPELHPAARVGAATHLVDLLHQGQLREHHANCVHAHKQFADKVAALERVFQELQTDVEALFMAVPPSDPEQLAIQARDMQLQAEEQASIAAAMEQDFKKVQGLVDEALHAVSAHPGATSVGPLDVAGVMEAIHDSHEQELLPRLKEGDAVLKRFTEHCLDCKNQMTQEVLSQLQIISAQQSKIGGSRDKLRMFGKVANRQSQAIDEVQLPRRIPTAYRHCLSECMRRHAFAEEYALTAGKVAEQMAKVRAEEVAARDLFRAAVDHYVPNALITALGLDARPPHCDISVPSPDAGLATIRLADLEDVPVFDEELKQSSTFDGDTSRSGGASPRGGSPSLPAREAAAPAVIEGRDEEDVTSLLQMENARLRAEVAKLVAMACVAEQKSLTAAATPVAAAVPSLPRQTFGNQASAGQHSPPAEILQQQDGNAVAAVSARFHRALAAKDDVASRLDQELHALRQQAAVYVVRIRDLEGALEARSVGQQAAFGGSSGTSLHSGASVCSPARGPAPGRAPSPPQDMTGRVHTVAELRSAGTTPAVLPADRPSHPPLQSPRWASAGSFTTTSSSLAAMPLSLDTAEQLQHAHLSPQSALPHSTGAAAAGDAAAAKGPLARVPTANVAQHAATMAGFASAVGMSTSTSGSTGGSPNTSSAAQASGGLSRQLAAAAAPQPPRLSAPVQEAAEPAFQPPTAVVTSPSLTSLAERAAAAASSGDLDEAPAATGYPQLPSSAATDLQGAVVSRGSPADPAITSGFRLTGFRVPSSELGESVSGSSSTAGAGRGIPILEPAGKARRRASFEAGQLPSARPAAETAASSSSDAAAAAAATSLLATPPAQCLRSCEGTPRSSCNAISAPGAAESIEAADDETVRPLPLPMSPPELEPPSRDVIAAMAAASGQQEGAFGLGAPATSHLSGRSCGAERELSQ